MKKLFGLLLTLILSANIQTFAANIEVQPTFGSRTNAQDRVWVGSFQLVWNDFMDRIVHNPIRFREGTPVSVAELNKKEFTTEDISESCYYKYTGKVTKNTKKTITKAIRKKFKESSDLLDKLELTPRADMYIVYAMMKKDFEFVNAFDKLGKSAFSDGIPAEYFGIGKDSDYKLGQGVNILFYNDSSDYAVRLQTKGNDEVYLYRTSTNKPFNFIYADMLKKQKTFTGNPEFKRIDELKVPMISLFEEKEFEELANKRVMGTNLVINKALETIQFDMDNKGVKLKSEAGMAIATTSLLPPEELVPSLFYFDDTFVIFLKEKNKNHPYFALRVHDIEKYQKNK